MVYVEKGEESVLWEVIHKKWEKALECRRHFKKLQSLGELKDNAIVGFIGETSIQLIPNKVRVLNTPQVK